MHIRGLGYVVLDVADVGAWGAYLRRFGAMVVEQDDRLRMRIDERPFRVEARATDGAEGLVAAGWELADAAALDVAADELAAAGHSVEVATRDECADRRVGGLIRTADPAGFGLELFHGPILDHEPLVSPTGSSGFVTGDQGMGHIVLGAPEHGDCVAFYVDVLGFRVSDVWRPDGSDVVFLHCNSRHHSVALAPASGRSLYHFMLEARTLDDVGYALDRQIDAGTTIMAGLGKHTNDHMVSFYSRTPSGFEVEFGCGGRQIDDATWTVTEITKPSFWGHRPPPG